MASYFLRDYFEIFGVFGSRDALQSLISSFGVFAPLIFIFFILVEVLVAPLPGSVTALAGAVVFGPILGTLYAWIGNVVGSILAFLIARHFGPSVVSFFVPSFRKKQERYNREISEHRNALFILYLLPVVPIDVVSFALGLSAIPFRHFFAVISFAFFVRMTVWNIFGDALGDVLFF